MSVFSFFPYGAITSIVCWLFAAICAWRGITRQRVTLLSLCGTMILGLMLIWIWIEAQRPPLRTMGEVRLWYSFFLSLVGWLMFARMRYRWMLSVSGLLASVFLLLSVFRPEMFQRELMPALQSLWFAPHVTVYILAYSILSIATLYAAWLRFRRPLRLPAQNEQKEERILVLIGWTLLSLGMVMGALWAKEAWGEYWSWDPKETWAAATWMSYLIYLHLTHRQSTSVWQFVILIWSFLLLQMCWYGIQYLPCAQGSIHVY